MSSKATYIKDSILIVLSIVIVLSAMPVFFYYLPYFKREMAKMSIKIDDNFTGGKKIAQFTDPRNDTETIPRSNPLYTDIENYKSRMDLTYLQISKVEFGESSIIGIEDRINFTLGFNHLYGDIHEEEFKSHLPTIHLYISSPGENNCISSNPFLAHVRFTYPWQYQVIIDPFHDRPRIYDCRGKLLGHALSLELMMMKKMIYGSPNFGNKVSSGSGTDRIRMGIALSQLNSMKPGKWMIYIFTGYPHNNKTSSLRSYDQLKIAEVFDQFSPESLIPIKTSHGDYPQVFPLNFEVF
jgi:hypothetical protein